MATRKSSTKRELAKKSSPPTKRSELRSGFEFKTLKHLEQSGVEFSYESETIPYTVPESKHRYVPDFIVRTASGHKLYLECKGVFDRASRKKMELVIAQHPDKDIRMIFQRNNSLSKKSKTTYEAWCTKRGIKCHVSASGHVPLNWLEE